MRTASAIFSVRLVVVLQDHEICHLPLVLQHIPQLLDWVELAALRWQEDLPKFNVEELSHRLGLVHTQVDLHHHALPALAHLPLRGDERQEGVDVVGGGEGVRVEQPPLSAHLADHGDGQAPSVRQLHTHALLERLWVNYRSEELQWITEHHQVAVLNERHYSVQVVGNADKLASVIFHLHYQNELHGVTDNSELVWHHPHPR